MSVITANNAGKQKFLTLLRELVRAYQAFASYDAAGYQGTDLTVAQADVIFTLGNTEGLSFKAIGEQTLITKGTLTGVVDRLVAKGLVERLESPLDRRSTLVRLTPAGVALFEQEFPRQVAYIKQRFDTLSKKEFKQTLAALQRLRALFETDESQPNQNPTGDEHGKQATD